VPESTSESDSKSSVENSSSASLSTPSKSDSGANESSSEQKFKNTKKKTRNLNTSDLDSALEVIQEIEETHKVLILEKIDLEQMREKLVKPFIGNLKSPNLIKIEKMDAPDQQNSDDSDNPEGSAPKKTKDGKSGTRIGGQNADTNGNEESKEDLLLKITQLELIILNTRRSEAYFKKKSEELIEKLHTIKILIEAS
jgi:hypothetical protein